MAGGCTRLAPRLYRSRRAFVRTAGEPLGNLSLLPLGQGHRRFTGTALRQHALSGWTEVVVRADQQRPPRVLKGLRELYGDVHRIGLFTGLFAEEPSERSAMPPLLGRMVAVDPFSHAL